jgi:hypothetical protein
MDHCLPIATLRRLVLHEWEYYDSVNTATGPCPLLLRYNPQVNSLLEQAVLDLSCVMLTVTLVE